ncbi:transmembrane sensor [Pseudomonas sp. TE3786]
MPASINEQAADWLLQLNEADASEQLRADFAAWKHQDPRHAAAAERLQGFIGQMAALRPQKASVHAALGAAYASRPKTYRNKRGASALLLLLAVLPAWLLWRSGTPAYWLADLHTAPGHWQTQTLADQSELTLNGNSAVNIAFDGERRHIQLLRGEVLVEVAHDPARPFIVETAQGQVRALGTRFVVKLENRSTLLTMLESRTAVSASQSPDSKVVDAGQQARIATGQVQLLGKVDSAGFNDAWQRHQLLVEDRPLSEVLEQLANQRSGFLYYDAKALGELRVSAVLPLDDSDRALQLIAEALPVTIKRITPWLVVVKPKP